MVSRSLCNIIDPGRDPSLLLPFEYGLRFSRAEGEPASLGGWSALRCRPKVSFVLRMRLGLGMISVQFWTVQGAQAAADSTCCLTCTTQRYGGCSKFVHETTQAVLVLYCDHCDVDRVWWHNSSECWWTVPVQNWGLVWWRFHFGWISLTNQKCQIRLVASAVMILSQLYFAKAQIFKSQPKSTTCSGL